MQLERPSFFDSVYLYIDENGEYQIKEDAPEEVKKEFKDYMEHLE